MTRMSREFSLVLLGAGLLTAGYFAWPEQDIQKRSEEQEQKRVGGHRSHGHAFIFIGYHGGARPPAMANVSKGGLGTVGNRVGGFGGS